MGNGHGGDFIIERGNEKVIALAGNPNVGKSTVFNALTGMKQHTGNWTGKTVQNAQGRCSRGGTDYVIVDIPGTYSLIPHSAEEEAARDFICFGRPDAVAVVCDATCLERNLNLALQILEKNMQNSSFGYFSDCKKQFMRHFNLDNFYFVPNGIAFFIDAGLLCDVKNGPSVFIIPFDKADGVLKVVPVMSTATENDKN